MEKIFKVNQFKIVAPEANSVEYMIPEIFGAQCCYCPSNLTIDQNDIVVDLGANVGVFTIYASQFTNGPIVAVEPEAENYSCLVRNILANSIKNVYTLNEAITDKEGETELYIDGQGSPLIFDHNIAGHLDKHVTVKTDTLQSIIDDPRFKIRASNVFLKMDIEGAAGYIIRSLSLEDIRLFSKIAMEYHENVSPMSAQDMARKIESAGFEVTRTATKPFGYIHGKRR